MTDRSRFEEEARRAGLAWRAQEPMKDHTSFAVGGPAEYFFQLARQEQIQWLLQLCQACGMPYAVIGRGSNLLVSDRGVQGVVLCIYDPQAQPVLLGEGAVQAPAAMPLGTLCRWAASQGLSGLEFACGIPGTVGGAVFMNAGAYGGEMKDILAGARHLYEGRVEHLSAGQMGLGYRSSAYQGMEGCCILEAQLALRPGEPAEIRGRMEELLRRRREKQPLELPSAGSTFQRPQGGYAAQMIEECGLKGLSFGGAQVSGKHAGFVVNTGGATAEDILRLIQRVQDEVYRQKGVRLKPEVKFLGF